MSERHHGKKEAEETGAVEQWQEVNTGPKERWPLIKEEPMGVCKVTVHWCRWVNAQQYLLRVSTQGEMD